MASSKEGCRLVRQRQGAVVASSAPTDETLEGSPRSRGLAAAEAHKAQALSHMGIPAGCLVVAPDMAHETLESPPRGCGLASSSAHQTQTLSNVAVSAGRLVAQATNKAQPTAPTWLCRMAGPSPISNPRPPLPRVARSTRCILVAPQEETVSPSAAATSASAGTEEKRSVGVGRAGRQHDMDQSSPQSQIVRGVSGTTEASHQKRVLAVSCCSVKTRKNMVRIHCECGRPDGPARC